MDEMKIIITESIVRRDLQHKDAEGVDCLPNATIFKQLTLMGSKTTAWNEFSSTMASVIICLAINQKINFSNYIFESMLKNLKNVSGKFLMYPRRVGKGFSGRVTPLFPTMVVQNQSKIDEAVHKERGDSLVRAATTASCLEAEQDSGNITKTRSKATPNESSSLGTTSCGGPKCQKSMGDTIVQTRFENVSKLFNYPLLARGNTPQSGKDRLKLEELMALSRVESSGDEEVLGEDESKQGRRIHDTYEDEDITMVNVQDDADKEMFNVNTLTGDEVFAEQEVAAKDVNLTVNEVTLAQALATLKSVK
ncbi:hypothetical protein Tco_0858314 [Tanacetum coccineum]|uniref:Uncharacterized protein n=1 Tax=Tanacetum coccineum TaxID=301880 RepID=A0ABQ5BBJ4_9ASTR